MDDDALSVISHQTAPQQQEERIKTKEELKAEKKQRRMNKIDRLQAANPPLSILWSVGDSPCFMTMLQIITLCTFAVSLYCTYIQHNISADHMCDSSAFGPYFGNKNNAEYACGWPQLNFVFRLIAPAICLILSFLMIPVTACWGRRLQKSIDDYNKAHFPSPEDAEKRVDYYKIYNKYCFFRQIRRIFSACSYVQLVSCGLDLAHFLTGERQAELENIALESSGLEHDFRAPIVVGFIVAIAARFTHDAIYLQPYKKSYQCTRYETYATATRTKEETIGPEVIKTERHHMDHTQTAMSLTNGFGLNHGPTPSHFDYAPSTTGVPSHYHYTPSVAGSVHFNPGA